MIGGGARLSHRRLNPGASGSLLARPGWRTQSIVSQLPDPYRHDSYGNGRIGQKDSRDLVASPSRTFRSGHHGFGHEPTHRKRKITEYPALQGDDYGCVPDQPGQCRAYAIQKSLKVGSLAVLGHLLLRLLRATAANDLSLEAVVLSAHRLQAYLALIAAGGRRPHILRRAELGNGVFLGKVGHDRNIPCEQDPVQAFWRI